MATIIPLPDKPIIAMNSPIPPVTANFMLTGIEFTTASLTLNKVNIINMIPSTNTAVKAISQGTFIPITTVNAKNAFNPIPDASANGKSAISPIMKHPKAADKQVAVTNAPAGIPVADSILGLTAIIYAIVKNVVTPANISLFIFTGLLLKSGNNLVNGLFTCSVVFIINNTSY